jgi:hypothetical protein
LKLNLKKISSGEYTVSGYSLVKLAKSSWLATGKDKAELHDTLEQAKDTVSGWVEQDLSGLLKFADKYGYDAIVEDIDGVFVAAEWANPRTRKTRPIVRKKGLNWIAY